MDFLLNKLPWQRLVKFVITGGLALAIDMGIYLVLTRFFHVPYLISRVISLSIAIIWNFSINRCWTFQATAGKTRRQFFRFMVVIIFTSLLNLALMKIGVSVFHIYDVVAIIIVSILITLINFFAHHFWSYAE